MACLGRPELVKSVQSTESAGEEARFHSRIFRVTTGWILASVSIGQGPRTFRGAVRRGPRNLPLRCLCQLPIHRKPTCQPCCPPVPAQRCQGTRHSKASWQLNGEPMARPAGPSAPCCQLHACGRQACSPSKWPRCQPLGALGQLASWQAWPACPSASQCQVNAQGNWAQGAWGASLPGVLFFLLFHTPPPMHSEMLLPKPLSKGMERSGGL